MTTSLYIDSETKNKAVQKAKDDNLSFSAVVRILLSDYASGRIEIGARTKNTYEVTEIEVDNKIQEKMDALSKQWRNLKK